MQTKTPTPTATNPKTHSRQVIKFGLVVAAASLVAIGVLALLINIMEHKQEAKNPFFRVVELTDDTDDPAIWGKNFPFQYDAYLKTVDQVRTKYGGSDALPRTPPKWILVRSSHSPKLKKIRV